MRLHHVSVVHAIQLIAGKDQHFVDAILQDVAKVLANGVRGALIPIGTLVDGLLRSQEFDKAIVEMVEAIRLAKVLMQRYGQELSQHIDAINIAVNAVADRDVDQAILARQRYRRFRSNFGQREQTRASSAAQN